MNEKTIYDSDIHYSSLQSLILSDVVTLDEIAIALCCNFLFLRAGSVKPFSALDPIRPAFQYAHP